MKFIPFEPSHKKSCIEVFNSNIPKYFAPHELGEFTDWLDKGQTDNYYVVLEDNQVIGCGGIYIDNERKMAGFAWGMIHGDHHRKGYGAAFSKFRIERIKALTDLDIFLVTSQHTFEFYRKLGFEVLSMEKDGFCEGLDKYEMKLVHE